MSKVVVNAGLPSAGLLLVLALAACSAEMGPAAPGGASSPPDSQRPGPVLVTIASAADPVTVGEPLQFRVSANPVPRAALTVGVTIASPGCKLAQSSGSVKIAAGKSQSTLEVPTRDVAVGEKGCVVTATIAAGAGYQIGAAAGASASATLAMQPVVTITADSASVTEGSPVSFTLTASPPPVSDLVVNVSWSEESGSFLPATTPRAATISASAPTAPLRVTTVDDDTDAQDGSVTVTVEAGSGYTVGSSGAATVTVTDNDTTSPGGGLTPTPPPSSSLPQIQIRNHTTSSVEEGEKHELQLVAFPEPESKLTVNLTWTDASRVENPPSTFMIPKPRAHEQSIHTLAVQTIENNVDDGDIRVYVEVADGSGYEPHPEPIFSSTSFVIKEDDD